MITSCKNNIFEKKTRKMKNFFWGGNDTSTKNQPFSDSANKKS